MTNEIWKDIKGYENIYQISNHGRVKSLQTYGGGKYKKREKILKPCDNGNGYYIVYLMKNKKRFVKYIHRLVAENFIPNLENKPCINHLDENPKNNHASNLSWCTYKENNNYGNHCLKLSKTKSRMVQQYDLNMNLIKTWNGIRKAMIETNSPHIVECCKGKVKTSGGFIWRYYETSC